MAVPTRSRNPKTRSTRRPKIPARSGDARLSVPGSRGTPYLAIGTVRGGRSRQQYANTPIYGGSTKRCRGLRTSSRAGEEHPKRSIRARAAGRPSSFGCSPLVSGVVTRSEARRVWGSPGGGGSPRFGLPPDAAHAPLGIRPGLGGTRDWCTHVAHHIFKAFRRSYAGSSPGFMGRGPAVGSAHVLHGHENHRGGEQSRSSRELHCGPAGVHTHQPYISHVPAPSGHPRGRSNPGGRVDAPPREGHGARGRA